MNPETTRKDKGRWILGGVLCVVVAVLVFVFRARIHFDWANFWYQLRRADPLHILVGILCIYLGYVLRAMRWAVFLKPQKKVRTTELIGTQVIGFTAVALFGRLADLVRPYLVAKRVQLSLGSQVAVYAVERMFDALAMALFFSATLAFSPDRATLPHAELFRRGGLVGLLVVLAGGAFAVLLRFYGEALASGAQRAAGKVSTKLGVAVADKIRAFRDGLNAIATFGDFLKVLVLSLVMWALIIGAYVSVVHAFRDTPELASLPFSHIMLLMAASMGGSIIQLPVIGWFTQIAATAATMQKLFGAPVEPSIGCGALLLIVTFMTVIPVGMIYARAEHVSLSRITEESDLAEDVLLDAEVEA